MECNNSSCWNNVTIGVNHGWVHPELRHIRMIDEVTYPNPIFQFISLDKRGPSWDLLPKDGVFPQVLHSSSLLDIMFQWDFCVRRKHDCKYCKTLYVSTSPMNKVSLTILRGIMQGEMWNVSLQFVYMCAACRLLRLSQIWVNLRVPWLNQIITACSCQFVISIIWSSYST